MSIQTDALWEINNEYRKRLSTLMGHMKLLEQLLVMQGNAEPALRATVRFIRLTLEEIDADHHDWRHKHFYASPQDSAKRRMVSEPEAVMQAISTFSGMLSRHLRQFTAINAAMADLRRPDPGLTRVIKGGDLWDMCLQDMALLVEYDQFVNRQLSGEP